MSKVAFIGLGNMGGPMAHNLVKAGHTVTGFDLSAEALKALAAAGGTAASSAAEAVVGAEVVVSMLPASQHVAGLYLGEAGLFSQLPAGTLVIDSSTIAAETSRQVSKAALEKGIKFIDAPVSGGVGGATAGTLSFIVGGSADDFAQAKPLLENMGKNIFHAGEAGAGQVAKACNNMLLSILMAGTTEALALGAKNGLDPAVLSEIMKQSSGANWVLNVYNPWPGVMEGVPASNGYQGGFQVDLMAKDLGLAWETALSSKSSIPMGSLARNLFALHAQKGNGGLDFSSIQQMFAE
ncbi:MAG TPA: 3-hydroxyisobutyrate dehydrogenase [Marinospirillum sp.]|uniref:3-hydroxyisobutyrate dehydrogenase n=1 Tax=Marinospirillum sp. TaxID=2183934 RepID=UPI002B47A3AA|nr:3-hydroxyisobutyrate dehydrogenase [Marinospirillum sp.]HKM15116.1 3-hydroxyisobutyrate dehydrogenase [Marinospirillum sp.]